MSGLKMEEIGSKTAQVVVLESANINPNVAHRQKSEAIKKHVILAVSCVLVTVIVVIGILVGAKFFLDATNAVVTRSFTFAATGDSGKQVTEDITSDSVENVLVYHVKEDDKETWILEDYNKNIQLMKIRSDSTYSCYLTPFNGSLTTVPDIDELTAPDNSDSGDAVSEGDEVYLRTATSPIKDKTMLGKSGRALCADIDVVWVIPACQDDKSPLGASPNSRQKRQMMNEYDTVQMVPVPPPGLSPRRYRFVRHKCVRYGGSRGQRLRDCVKHIYVYA
jgi:hypothetical protein